MIVGLYWLVPYRLPWWALTAGVTLFAAAAALLLYEAVVRPTFLVRLFGPSSSSRPEMAPPAREPGPSPSPLPEPTAR